MKDAKGHGSDPRAGHKLAADYRSAHQLKINTVPSVAQAVGAEFKRMMKDTGAAGKPAFHEVPDDSEKYQNVGESYAEALSSHSHHIEPSHLMHALHFLHSMAALAVAEVVVRNLSHLV